jgi:peptidoglycan hydrolase-like protein with peptidoglycan-binding domain
VINASELSLKYGNEIHYLTNNSRKKIMEAITQSAVANPSALTVNMPVLDRNDRGEAVRFLQQLLICYGYLGNDGFDAIFGLKTEKAVKAFQLDSALTADGVVGKNTWRALGSRCSL